ncbi:hypothetical protein ACUNFV_23735, partial [Serratia sp. IR-2025]
RLIRCVCGKKIGPDPRNFNQRVSLGRNDLLIRTFPKSVNRPLRISISSGTAIPVAESVTEGTAVLTITSAICYLRIEF